MGDDVYDGPAVRFPPRTLADERDMQKSPVRVVRAEYVRNYQIKLRFNDVTEKVVDFSRWLHGEVFKPLVDKREFKRFFVAGGTVSWPNGADIAPETLRDADAATDAAN